MKTPKEHFNPYAYEKMGRALPVSQQRIELMFVLMDIAQATSIPLGGHSDRTVLFGRQLAKELATLGLYTDVVTYNHERINALFVLCGVTQESIAILTRLVASDAKDHQVYGRLCGYPQTAIDGFHSDQDYDESYLPGSILGHPLYPGCPFVLSHDHFQAEWDWFCNTVYTIHKNRPDVTNFLGLTDMVYNGMAFDAL